MRGKARGSTVFFFFALMCVALLAGALAHASLTARAMAPEVEIRAAMVRELGLSDLCLFTEARYTRHPSVADLNSPFQDHPLSLEHFPTGSLIEPPRHLTRGKATP